MNFACKDFFQRIFIPSGPREETPFLLFFAGCLMSGGAAGASSLCVTYPLEYAFTRLAADGPKREFNGIMDCLLKTIAKDGPRGVYRGFAPSVGGIIVYRAGYFGLYDTMTDYVLPYCGFSKSQQHTSSMIVSKFFLALGIDIGSALLAYPLDTIRRSLMMQGGKPIEERLYHNSRECAQALWKKGGPRSFYRGAYTNCIRSVGAAMVLVLFSEIKFYTTGH